MDANDVAEYQWSCRTNNRWRLRSRWFSWWGMEHAALCLAYKGGQYSIYESLQPFTTQNTKDAKPKIVIAPLRRIFIIGQGAYRFLFVLHRLPILHLSEPTAMHNTEYQWCKTKHLWHSIDAHFHDGAGSMSLSLCPTEAANHPFMISQSHSQLWLPIVQNHKIVDAPLTLILMDYIVKISR
jgi:hypothetical protein